MQLLAVLTCNGWSRHMCMHLPNRLFVVLLQVASAQAKLRPEQQRSNQLESELDAERQRHQALQLHHLRPRSPDRAAQAAWTAERRQLSTQVGTLAFLFCRVLESKALQAAWPDDCSS